MIASILIGLLIFSYAGWTLWQYVRKSRQGKCAACSFAKAGCSSSCEVTPSDTPS